MSDPSKPPIEIIRPPVEILPSNDAEARQSVGSSRIFLSVDSHGGTRRIYVAKPGPIASFFLLLAAGAIVIASLAAAFVVGAVLLGLSVLAIAGLSIYGLLRRSLGRPR